MRLKLPVDTAFTRVIELAWGESTVTEALRVPKIATATVPTAPRVLADDAAPAAVLTRIEDSDLHLLAAPQEPPNRASCVSSDVPRWTAKSVRDRLAVVGWFVATMELTMFAL